MTATINLEDMNWVAVSPELILMVTAFLLLLVGLKKTYNQNAYLAKAAAAGIVTALLLSCYLWGIAPTVADGANPEMFSHALIHDRFSQTFNLIFLIMSLFAITASFRYPRPDHENKAEYFALLLMTVVGMMFLAKSGNLITAFISLEIFSISLYILCGFNAKHGTGREQPGDVDTLPWETVASQESTVKYLLIGAFASAILVYGMALLYAGTGTTEIRTIGKLLHENPYTHNPLVFIGMALMFSGLAFKVSLVPFHSWTPDVYQGAPTPITGFMSVATKAAAFALIARVFYIALPDLQSIWMPFLFGVSVVTMLVGNIAAIFQDDVKRMLAYSGVAHAGYLLIGIVANSQDGVASIIFYLAVYLFMNVGAFAVVYMVEGEGKESNSIYRFKGLAKRKPLMAAAMSLFMLSLAGFPPTAGFFGKLYVFVAAIKQDYILITILAVVASMIAVYFYLRIIVMMYFHESEPETVVASNRGMTALITVSSAAIVLMGIFPSTFMQLALSAIPSLPH
ncbi:NADH-quinone oxidoreductase subunit N [Nitrospina watsonii]|uniref:NADH-quinone oxidoreductase subunit N n=1 Tax=Nitrospina watsonii TaxID=1323948 RepID=A0ABN8VXE8_9BACT|nr:NADH-quinone oxidoreductase subunit N [Nitrospina watsonii]CAI2717825.1 NADH-quinone oxidoreductase, subunit N [Nitrospina watsonii]